MSPFKQDTLPNLLLSQHLHIAFLLFPFFSFLREVLVLLHVNWRCPVEVKFIRSRPGGQNHTGRKRAAASTYEAKQTVWLLSLGRPCWRVSWFLSFPPRCLLSPLFCFLLALVFFLLLCTAFGVCVWFINPQGATLRERGKGERRRKRDSRHSGKELDGSANAIFNHYM